MAENGDVPVRYMSIVGFKVDGCGFEVIRMAAEGCPFAAIEVQEVDREKGDSK
jgi:ferredoxin